jgi:predicted HAD superfamily Cof-like phosphohydrolase
MCTFDIIHGIIYLESEIDMRTPFHMVSEFQQKILGVDQAQVLSPLSQANKDHLYNCLIEEAIEMVDSHVIPGTKSAQIVDAVDALMDSIYFAIGGLHKIGLSPHQMHECFAAVHLANMTKKKGIIERRGDGSAPDAVKPEGWKSPEERIAEILGVTYVG